MDLQTLLQKKELTLSEIKFLGIPIEEIKFISVGGGMGSFCWVDTLRVHGVKPSEIAVISPNSLVYSQFKKYCDNSELTSSERIRSDSGSRPDNFWGFPGYAISELIEEIKNLKFISALSILWQIFSEPIGADFFTPKAGMVYRSLDREMLRIGWSEILREGYALTLRKLSDGHYAIFYQTLKGEMRIIIGNIIHVSLGHKLKPSSFQSVYQPNGQLFEKIEAKGGRVLVIGRGIAAARIIEKLILIRKKEVDLEIISIFRRPYSNIADLRGAVQKGFAGWRLQFFNWPRSAFGGHIAEYINKLDENSKSEAYAFWSIATTAPKREWLKLIKKALSLGFYKYSYGKINTVTSTGSQLTVNIDGLNIPTDFIIDCSGFDDRAKSNAFLNSLINFYGLQVNSKGGLKTNNCFEIEELSQGTGKVFITGIGASGNSYGPVDSFFGHQFGSYKSIESLFHLNPLDSVAGWLKWVFNIKI